MINKSWSRLAKEDIERLVSDCVPESHTLDYKQALPDESPKSKVDFLVDVSAMANASGGDLVFGITEHRVEGKPTSIPNGYANLKIKSLDESKRRLESLIREGIEPALSVKIVHFDGLPEGPVILLRVSPSGGCPSYGHALHKRLPEAAILQAPQRG
jgi:predicted HTH transcriptional regulator